MNTIKKIAEMYGLKLGEKFKINDGGVNSYEYHFDEKYGLVDNTGCTSDNELTGILTGDYKIIKRPWKPKEDEHYYQISMNRGIIECNFFEPSNEEELLQFKIGNCFPTRAEAERHIDEIAEKFKKIREEYENA